MQTTIFPIWWTQSSSCTSCIWGGCSNLNTIVSFRYLLFRKMSYSYLFKYIIIGDTGSEIAFLIFYYFIDQVWESHACFFSSQTNASNRCEKFCKTLPILLSLGAWPDDWGGVWGKDDQHWGKANQVADLGHSKHYYFCCQAQGWCSQIFENSATSTSLHIITCRLVKKRSDQSPDHTTEVLLVLCLFTT